jgi:hypothetical protein
VDDLERGRVFREADWAREMTGTTGWAELARWVMQQAALECEALERGVSSWDDYQRSVGRIGAFREVLARPEELVDMANRAMRGDSE